MKQRIRKSLRILTGNAKAGRDLTVFSDDVFLVSYPKSGNTWTRFLLSNLIFPDHIVTFNNIDQLLPDIYQDTDKILARINRPRILKSHEYFDPRYQKVIYIVRDPRDVCVSLYHHMLKFKQLSENISLDKFVDEFIYQNIGGRGSWAENVGSWLGARSESSNFLLLRYEDLLQNTASGLRDMASFLYLDLSDDIVSKAVIASSLDSMRKIEREASDQWRQLKLSDKNRSFVRSGVAGGWKEQLSLESVNKIEIAWGNVMHQVGYPVQSY